MSERNSSESLIQRIKSRALDLLGRSKKGAAKKKARGIPAQLLGTSSSQRFRSRGSRWGGPPRSNPKHRAWKRQRSAGFAKRGGGR